MSASINILNYNTYEKTYQCIISCLDQDYQDYEIILVDNKSTDDSLQHLKDEFGDSIVYLENDKNYGYAGGNNRGVFYSYQRGNDYSFLLNSDTTLVGNSLVSDLMSIATNDESYYIVAPYVYDVTQRGLIRNMNDSAYLELLRRCRILPENRVLDSSTSTISEAHGSALLVRNDKFIDVGGFPEHFFMYGEESYLAKQVLWNNGIIVLFKSDEEYVLHHHDKSHAIDSWRLYLMGRNRTLEYYEFRNRSPLAWRLIYTGLILKRALKTRRMKDPYLIGIRSATRLRRQSHEEILLDGLAANSRLGC